MKKIVLSLAAIATLSTAAFAYDRSQDLRDLHPEYFASTSNVVVETAPMAAGDGVLTAFGRVTMISMEREHGSR